MTENKKISENKPLTDKQLSGVTGGEKNGDVMTQPMEFKRCAANPDHMYVHIHDACPVCGCKEFTSA